MLKDIVFSSVVWCFFEFFEIEIIGGEAVRNFDVYIPTTSIRKDIFGKEKNIDKFMEKLTSVGNKKRS